MGNLYRWCCCLFLVGVFLVSAAKAETIPATSNAASTLTSPPTETWYSAANLNGSAHYSTWGAACDASRSARGMTKESCVDDAAPLVGGSADCRHYAFGGCSNTMGWKFATCSTGYVFNNQQQTCTNNAVVYTCPATGGWTLSGQSCVRTDCAQGEFHDQTQGGVCKKDCTSKQGMATASGQYSTSADSWTGTVGGCQVKCSNLTMLVASPTSVVGMMKNCTYTGKTSQTGEGNLEAEAAPNPNEPPKSIKGCAGAGMGYVQSSSGAVTCVPAADAPEGQKPKEKARDSKESGTDGNGDGKADTSSPDYKKTDTETTKDGDKVTQKKTDTVNGTPDGLGGVTCPAGYSKNADNTCSKTTVSTQTTNSFCAENPSAEQCKGGQKSTFNGSCSGGFSCDGDAATCAIARASWESRCAMTSDATTNLFDSDNPGGTEAQNLNAQKALNKDGAGDFNVWTAYQQNQHNYFTYTASCPLSVTEIPLPMGRSISIDPSLVCQIGEFVRLLVHIFAYMALIRLFATKLV